jgi:hypothetical protein
MHTRTLTGVLAGLLLPLVGCAQTPPLDLSSLANLKGHAVNVVDVHVGPLLLGLVGPFLDDHDPDSAQIRQIVKGLQSVEVHSYQFRPDFVPPAADLDALRSRLNAPDWHQLVQVRDRGSDNDVDIYCAMHDHTITGLAILAVEPHALTVVHVVGTIDLDQVSRLSKVFVHTPVSPQAPPLSMR